ncbi:MAG TPA: TRAP transporter large permease [Salinisphaeraceae bacterium]|nr:TRAP transporter large permease [Salinisphaeraceae bacterium]
MSPDLLLVLIFVILLALGVPVAITLGAAAVSVLLYFDLAPETLIAQNFYASIKSFPLLAIPFFILAGVLLKEARLAERLVNLFRLLVGGVHGGLALVAVMTGIFWGAISGSGPATTAALGVVMISAMVRAGYSAPFAAAAIAASADLSIVIPPSVAFIIYGNLTATSVSKLFIGGIVPGLLMGGCMLVVVYLISRKRGYRGVRKAEQQESLLRALWQSSFAIFAPVIILGGIYAGIFTATEAAVVAVIYSLVVAALIYRTLSWTGFVAALVEASVLTAMIMFIVAWAGLFSWTGSVTGVVDEISHWLVNLSDSRYIIILLICALVLALGMVLDPISIMYLVVPILIPVVQQFDMNPIWFGVTFVSALAIGQVTPPVGVNLFTAAGIINEPVDAIAREVLPLVAAAVIGLIIIALWPAVALVLVN